jgi:hypothetical protein
MIRTVATPVNALVGPATPRHVRSRQPHRKMNAASKINVGFPVDGGVEGRLSYWPAALFRFRVLQVRAKSINKFGLDTIRGIEEYGHGSSSPLDALRYLR